MFIIYATNYFMNKYAQKTWAKKNEFNCCNYHPFSQVLPNMEMSKLVLATPESVLL